MTKGILLAVLAIGLSASALDRASLCEGFVPKNDRYISVPRFSAGATGISEADFNTILDNIQKIYAPIIEGRGGVLDIQRLWTDGTVNASAERIGTTYRLNMYGGMARHELMTVDGFMLIACHEMGHHLGGAPKFSSIFGGTSWAAVEGQADYFGTAKCMKRMFQAIGSRHSESITDESYAAVTCGQVYANGADQANCVRNIAAGVVLGNVLNALGSGTQPVSLQTPSQAVFAGIDQSHPAAQCRLDTYFQGAVCGVPFTQDFSDTDNVTGACTSDNGYSLGLRPKCWFNPDAGSTHARSVNAASSIEIYY